MEQNIVGDMNTSREALTALQQKYSGGMPNVYRLSDEQKAWLELKIQTLAEGLQPPQPIMELHKIRNRLAHATEDIPDKELQKMVSFVFNNMEEIRALIETGCTDD
jgi:hypothetical protein